MSRIENAYATASNYYNSVQQKKEKEKTETAKADSTKATEQTEKTSQVKLSEKAQKLLEKLKKEYSDMDFMVADFQNGDEAKKILSGGTKEYSVLFSSDELEKMAADESYEKENRKRLEQAVEMSKRIDAQFGTERAFGKNGEQTTMTKFGVSFGDDGTMQLFADLERTSEQQWKAQEKAIAKKKEEAKKEEKASEKKKAEAQAAKKVEQEKEAYKKENSYVKKTTVQANGMEELLKKIEEVDWEKISPEDPKESGQKVDFVI